jgi:translation initiation factor 5A
MEGDDVEFQVANAGSSATYPVQCSALRKNGYVMIKARPCKVIEMSTSKTGKHGHAKVHLVGMDIFTNKKYEDLCPSTHNIDVPNVTRSDFQLIDISDDGFATLMNDKGDTRDDLQLPDSELGQKIREEYPKEDNTVIVTVMAAVGEEQIIACKNANS